MIPSYTIFDDAISKITYETVMIFSFSILSSIYFHVYLRFIVILYFCDYSPNTWPKKHSKQMVTAWCCMSVS